MKVINIFNLIFYQLFIPFMLLTFIYFNSVDVVAMKLPFFIVDAFTIPEVPFSGNQAAIVVLDTDVSTESR